MTQIICNATAYEIPFPFVIGPPPPHRALIYTYEGFIVIKILKNKLVVMKSKITPQQNQSNMQNANKGTSGTNKQYSQNQGDRGKQLNSGQAGKGSIKGSKKS